MTSPIRRLTRRLARHHGALRPLALAAASLFTLQPALSAGPVLPGGLAVVAGQATQATTGNRLTVTNSAGALLNWQQFSIGAGAAVHFAQPSAASKVLNRVVGSDPSSILGSLSSNGQVWLLNPNGVLFGAGARVDVAGLVASTLSISDAAWQDGLRSGRFSLGDAATTAFGSVVNQGELRSASGGQVLLVGGAGGVRNAGLVHAPDGQVLLAAGAQVDLVDTSAPRVGVRLQAPQGEVLNLGRLLAGNGRIDLQAAVVNQQGIVRADSLGAGGTVLASASQALTLGAGSVTSASGAAGGGQVALDAGTGTLLASGAVDATSAAGNGGQVSLLGRQVGLLDGAAVDASGATGGGAVRVGGGLRGQDSAFRNADASFLAPGARISADATVRGDGGLVVLWGSQAQRSYGTLSARGGPQGGDGGFIETSGGWIDARPQAVRTGAPAGMPGQWLIDPFDIRIEDDINTSGVSGGPDFTSVDSPSKLNTTTINQALNAGTSVSVTTGPGSGAGDITVSSATISAAPSTPVSLTLNASRNIVVENSTVQSQDAPLTLHLVAGSGGGTVGLGDNSLGSGGSIRIAGSSIDTKGGDIVLGGPSVACGPTLGCVAGNTGAVAASTTGTVNGVEVSGSQLMAGTGAIRIDGHSLSDFYGGAGIAIQENSVLQAREIALRGTVDAGGDDNRRGVWIDGSQIDASARLAVTGVAVTPTKPTESQVTGVLVSSGSVLHIGGADGAVMTLDGSSSTPGSTGSLLVGLQLIDEGTRLVATNGAAIDLVGKTTGDGFRLGVTLAGGLTVTEGPTQPVIQAGAASRLTMQSNSHLFLNSNVVAPSGGTLSISAGDGLYIDGMSLTGSPTQATFSGSWIAIGSGDGASLNFEGPTDLLLQTDVLTLGSDNSQNASLLGPVKHALAANVTAPPAFGQALLASGGRVRIEANSVVLNEATAVYAAGDGTAIDIRGRQAGSGVAVLTNLAGSSALQTPAGRWLLHATDSFDGNANFQPAGLQAAFWQYGDVPGTTAAAQGGNGFLFTATPTIGVVGSGNPISKIYDGTTTVDLQAAGLTLTGKRTGQALAGVPVFADKNAGVGKPLVLAAAPGGAVAFLEDETPIYGYAVDAATLRGTITPRTLTLSGVTAADKVYDGGTTAQITAWTLGQVLAGDDVQVSAGSAQFSSPGAGTAKAVSATATALGGVDGGNYSTDGLTAATTASITRRPLGLASVAVAGKVYDGTRDASVTGWTLSNVVAGDQVQALQVSAQFQNAGAGADKAVLATANGVGGASAGNYSLAGATAATTATVSPATLVYQADPASVQKGQALPVLTGAVTGFVAGETLAGATSGTLRFTADIGAATLPGSHPITGSGLSAANYGFVQAPGNATALTLLPAPPPDTPTLVPPDPRVQAGATATPGAALLAVLTPPNASSPSSGRSIDALAVVQAVGDAPRFDTLDLDRMSAASLASTLAARDAYKGEVFKAAKDELSANPGAADAPGCASQQQAASGQCLLLRPVGTGLDISNARVVERVQGVPPPASAVPGPAPTPAPSAAPAVAAAPAAPAAPRAPAPAVPRVQPLPADLRIALPQRQAVARAAVPQIQRKIAVLIGIDSYRDNRIPQLGNAVADARAVARTLTERLGYETVVLENPGKATIFRVLNQLAGQVGPNDSVVLYYAGHGERVEKTGLGYWQPADADASRADTWISNADIDRLLRTLPASQLAMVSDSCFSGSLVTGERIRGVPAVPDPAALLAKRAAVVMTSGGNEPVFDSGLNGHSPFAWNLMQSLNQVGGQAGGWKAGSSVFEQVRFAVARKLPQRPQYGASSGGGHESGADYLFEQRQLR